MINLNSDSYTVCEEKNRLDALPDFFGADAISFENAVFVYMDNFSLWSNNSGWGYFDFYRLTTENQTCICMLKDSDKTLHCHFPNGFEAQISLLGLSIIANLYVLNALCYKRGLDKYIEAYYLIREFALAQNESSLIFAAID